MHSAALTQVRFFRAQVSIFLRLHGNNINTWLHWKVSKNEKVWRWFGVGAGLRGDYGMTGHHGTILLGLKAKQDGACAMEADRVAQWKQWNLNKKNRHFLSKWEGLTRLGPQPSEATAESGHSQTQTTARVRQQPGSESRFGTDRQREMSSLFTFRKSCAPIGWLHSEACSYWLSSVCVDLAVCAALQVFTHKPNILVTCASQSLLHYKLFRLCKYF